MPVLNSKLFCSPLILLLACSTGSQFERQQGNLISGSTEFKTNLSKSSIAVGTFKFHSEQYSANAYKKGLWLPGYLGVDFESFGPWPAEAKSQKLTNIYDHPDFQQEFAEFVRTHKYNSGTAVNNRIFIDGEILRAITAVRYHTYGCWPLIGTFANLFNAESLTIINSTTIQYQVKKSDGTILTGELIVATPKTYRFWKVMTYKLGLDIGAMQTEAMETHLTDIKNRLLTTVLAL